MIFALSLEDHTNPILTNSKPPMTHLTSQDSIFVPHRGVYLNNLDLHESPSDSKNQWESLATEFDNLKHDSPHFSTDQINTLNTIPSS